MISFALRSAYSTRLSSNHILADLEFSAIYQIVFRSFRHTAPLGYLTYQSVYDNLLDEFTSMLDIDVEY